MSTITLVDLLDPSRLLYKLKTRKCQFCNEQGVYRGEADPPDLFALICLNADCGEVVEWVPAPTMSEVQALDRRPSSFITEAGDEDALKRRISARLKPDFVTFDEVFVRVPSTSGPTLRIDKIAVPRPHLVGFTWPFFGIEVKREAAEIKEQSFAWAQSIAYQGCVLVDKRLPRLKGEPLDCVALYQGRKTSNRHQPAQFDRDGLGSRIAGRFNVGELVHDHFHDLALLLSEECVWSRTVGVTVRGTNWPQRRAIAHSRPQPRSEEI